MVGRGHANEEYITTSASSTEALVSVGADLWTSFVGSAFLPVARARGDRDKAHRYREIRTDVRRVGPESRQEDGAGKTE